MAPDGAGGVLIAGSTTGVLGGSYAGGWDVFLACYDANGNRVWITQFGTASEDRLTGAAPDGESGVLITGWTSGSLGGPSAGLEDAWVAHYDFAGERDWINQFGTESWDFAWAATPNGAGGVLVAGFTYGDLAGPNAGYTDGFLASYDTGGNQGWITQFGTSLDDPTYALAQDELAGAFVSGYTDGNLFGPNAGSRDVVLARFGTAHCYPDLSDDGVLDLFDFLGFVNLFNAEDPAADCVDDGVFDLFDFLCFVNAFNAGC